MDTIKLQLQNDFEILKELSQTDCSFDFIWTLADPDHRIRHLRIMLTDPLEVAAYYKQFLLTTLRGYSAAAGIIPAGSLPSKNLKIVRKDEHDKASGNKESED